MRIDAKRQVGAIIVLAVMASMVCCGSAAEKPLLEPKAMEVVKTMSAYMMGLKSFQFRTDETAEGVAPVGGVRLKVQYASQRTIAVKRPGQFAGEVGGDLTRRKLWMQDGKLTFLDLDELQWMVTPIAADPKETMQALRDQSGMIIPLAALVSRDLHAAIREHADFAAYLGLHSVGDEACHHVIFRGQGYVWQLWISAGDRPLPLKFVVTNLSESEQPQQIVRLMDWKINPSLSDGRFKPDIPAKAKETKSLGFIFWVPAAN